MTVREVLFVASMAFRNLGRHRVKTIITVTAVAVSVSMYIFMDAWLTGMNLDSQRNIVMYEIGAAKIQRAAYFSDKDELPMYENFGGHETLAAALAKAGYVSAPRFVFTGTLHSRSGSAPLVINAVDPVREDIVLRYSSFIDSGRALRPGERGLLVGSMAAEKLRVGIPQRLDRDEFEEDVLQAARDAEEEAFLRSMYISFGSASSGKSFMSRKESDRVLENRLVLKTAVSDEEKERLWDIFSSAGRMDVRIATTIDIRDEKTGAIRHVNQLVDAVVVGVVNSPNPQTNGNVAYMPMDSLQDETGMMLEGRVTELIVRLAAARDTVLPGHDEQSAVIRSRVLAALRDSAADGEAASLAAAVEDGTLGVYYWEDYVADYIAAARGDNVSTRIMAFFLFLLSFIGIANTMLMSILERTKEIGMLRALGMTDGQLVLSYTTEAAIVGFIGSTAGLFIGILINIPMVRYGIDFSAMTEVMNGNIGYRVASYFRSAWNIPSMIGTFVLATVTSALMAVMPTVHALKMPVTDSLRFE